MDPYNHVGPEVTGRPATCFLVAPIAAVFRMAHGADAELSRHDNRVMLAGIVDQDDLIHDWVENLAERSAEGSAL